MPFLESLKNKVRGFFTGLPPQNLPPEKEDELIEKIATTIAKYGLETPAILLGAGLVPISTIIGQTTMLPMSPILELVGIHGYDYAALLNNKNNIVRLIQRLKDMEQQRYDREGFW